MSFSAQPTGFPGWASGPSGWLAQPLASVQALGWQPNQAPQSAYQNWLHNLTYGWIVYHQREVSLRTVVEEDFTSASVGITGAFNYRWSISPSGWKIGDQFSDGLLVGQMGSAECILPNQSPIAVYPFTTNVGSVNNRDFRIEAYAGAAPIASGSYQVGVIDQCAFVATGPSAFWGFNFTPSGAAGPTAMTFSGVFSSGLSKLLVERTGSQLVIEINDALVATMTAVAFGATSAAPLGAQVIRSTLIGGTDAWLDRIALKVIR